MVILDACACTYMPLKFSIFQCHNAQCQEGYAARDEAQNKHTIAHYRKKLNQGQNKKMHTQRVTDVTYFNRTRNGAKSSDSSRVINEKKKSKNCKTCLLSSTLVQCISCLTQVCYYSIAVECRELRTIIIASTYFVHKRYIRMIHEAYYATLTRINII